MHCWSKENKNLDSFVLEGSEKENAKEKILNYLLQTSHVRMWSSEVVWWIIEENEIWQSSHEECGEGNETVSKNKAS